MHSASLLPNLLLIFGRRWGANTRYNQPKATLLCCHTIFWLEGLMKIAVLWVLMVVLLAGCSAHELRPEASSVTIVINKPDTARCTYLGEITGSPGNLVTEDYTSNEVLLVGASNDLRNQAYGMGGNTIHLQKVDDSSAWILTGTTSISVTGRVYNCK